jgi:menaquinol-cytochrome c reductase iron-sulfur subunit
MKIQNQEPSNPPSRRGFFKYLVNGIGATIAAILAIPLGGFYALPALKKAKLIWKECGAVEDFTVGEIKLVPLKPLERRQWPEDWGTEAAFVYRRDDGSFVVYNLHCTHVGCPVNWSPQAKRFFSPCHGGVFDADGRVLAGPPPRPLDRYEVKIENGVLYAGPVYRVNKQLGG